VKPPAGYVFVVQKALGSGAFTTAITTTATTAHFHAPSTGTYKLRASLQKSTGAVNPNWFSDPVTLTVR
jgi:hypothetical protein